MTWNGVESLYFAHAVTNAEGLLHLIPIEWAESRLHYQLNILNPQLPPIRAANH